MRARNLATVARSVSRLGVSPPWLREWMGHTTPLLASLPPFDLASCLVALAHFDAAGDGARGGARSGGAAAASRPSDVTTRAGDVAALLRTDDGSAWLDAFWAASLTKLQLCSQPDVSASAEAAAGSDGRTAFDANDAVSCLFSASQLDIRPPQAWMDAFFDATVQAAPSFPPPRVQAVLTALARQNVVPPSAWLEALMNAPGAASGGSAAALRERGEKTVP